MNNLDELAKAAYENAKAKGFYDKPVSIPERMALIHSELSEALEADRKDRYAGLEKGALVYLIQHEETAFKIAYETKIKGTFEEEMADVVIRILDLAGSKNRPIGEPDAMWPIWDKAKTTPEQIAILHYFVSHSLEVCLAELGVLSPYFWNVLFTALEGCKVICREKGINLELHVKAKMRYNSLRPRMHGGKKY